MRLIGTFSQLIIAICLLIITIQMYAVPTYAKWKYGGYYKKLTSDCDMAMHNEAALRENTDFENHPNLYITSEIEMLVCHEYDLLRKKMLSMGIDENYLSLLNLESLENQKIPLKLMIEPHKMERF
ncbi:MAG: TIGR03982 family His-Xaa-Ser system protein [Flavobacteriales bacterium]